jgi:hypothetical protein
VDRTAKRVAFEVVKVGAGSGDFDPFDGDGTTREGAATCLVCNQSVDGDFFAAGRYGWGNGPATVGTDFERNDGGRDYRPTTMADEALFEQARRIPHKLQTENAGVVPDEPMDSRRPSAVARGLSAVIVNTKACVALCLIPSRLEYSRLFAAIGHDR